MAVVAIFQQRSDKSAPLMHLYLFSAFYGFYFSARHVLEVLNEVADALSWNKEFLYLTGPHTDQLHRLLISERPDWGSQSWTTFFTSSLIVVSQNPPRRCTSQANGISCPLQAVCPEPIAIFGSSPVAFLAAAKISYGLRSYLSAVRHLHIMSGNPDPSITAFPCLKYALRAFDTLVQ